jgi:TrmH family RNA methyltransferase
MADIRIVLVGTQHPGNIGSAARAMKTMGLTALHLVAPERFPDPEAVALSAGADDLLGGAQIHDDLASALVGCRLVLGCTARRRTVPLPELAPREAAERLQIESALGPVALLFGRERTGLENHELQCCDAAVHIPANPEFSSLNVASAVQILAYEIRMAGTGTPGLAASAEGPAPFEAQGEPAPREQMERFFEHLAQALEAIDFHKGRSPDRVTQRLRRLFLRARPDMRELRILHGILAESERMARLARAAPRSEP